MRKQAWMGVGLVGLLAGFLAVPAASSGSIGGSYGGSVGSTSVNVTCTAGEQGNQGDASITVSVAEGGAYSMGDGNRVVATWLGQSYTFVNAGSHTFSTSTAPCPATDQTTLPGTATFTPYKGGSPATGGATQTVTLTYNRVGSAS